MRPPPAGVRDAASTLVQCGPGEEERSGECPYPRRRGGILSTPAHTTRGPVEERDLGGMLRLARRGWWAIVLAAVVGAAFAAVLGSRADSVYQSEVRMLVGPPGERVSQLRAAGQRAQTYAELATSRPVLDATRKRLGLQTSLTRLAADVRAQADDVTRLLTITARASSARGAARLASVIPEELTRVAFGGRPPPPNELRTVEPAETPSASLGASRLPMILLAAVTGALVALTFLLLADAVRGRVRGPLELAEA